MKNLRVNTTKFSPEEMCGNIIPVCLKPRARVEYVKKGRESSSRNKMLLFSTDYLRISGDINCNIDVQSDRKRAHRYKKWLG